jgi:hypothetical protein
MKSFRFAAMQQRLKFLVLRGSHCALSKTGLSDLAELEVAVIIASTVLDKNNNRSFRREPFA